MRAGWDYLEPLGIDSTEVGGEVLACPDDNGYWTPSRLAETGVVAGRECAAEYASGHHAR